VWTLKKTNRKYGGKLGEKTGEKGKNGRKIKVKGRLVPKVKKYEGNSLARGGKADVMCGGKKCSQGG